MGNRAGTGASRTSQANRAGYEYRSKGWSTSRPSAPRQLDPSPTIEEHTRIRLQRVVPQFGALKVRKELSDGGTHLLTGKMGAQAKMDPVTEGEVLAERAIDPKGVRIVELSGVPVGGRE